MSNDDQLKVRQTVSKKKSFKEFTIVRDIIFWIDLVGEGQNENAIFARPFNEKEAFPQKLTCKKYNIKNNFHGYGGKSYKCIYCLLYTSPSPRDKRQSRMPSSA